MPTSQQRRDNPLAHVKVAPPAGWMPCWGAKKDRQRLRRYKRYQQVEAERLRRIEEERKALREAVSARVEVAQVAAKRTAVKIIDRIRKFFGSVFRRG